MLEINTQEQLMIVRLKADLDMTGAKVFKETVDAFLLMNPQIKTLQIDLSAVSFIDSSGLGAIIGRYKNMLLRQGTLSLVNPAPNVCPYFRDVRFEKARIRVCIGKGGFINER